MRRAKDKSAKIERVQVSVRIRPFNDSEKEIDPTTPIKSIDQKNSSLKIKLILSQIIKECNKSNPINH